MSYSEFSALKSFSISPLSSALVLPAAFTVELATFWWPRTVHSQILDAHVQEKVF